MSGKPTGDGLAERVKYLERCKSELEATCRDQQASADLLNAIRKAQSLYISDADPDEIYKLLLQSLVDITESQYGFLDEVFYDDAGKAFKKNLAISNIAWDEKSKVLYRQLQDRGLTFAYLDNLSGYPARTGKTIIANDPAADSRAGGLPEGHPAIHSFLGMPMFFGGKLICVAGVANRAGGYCQAIADFLEPLLSTCASITYALRKEADEKETARKLAESEARYRSIFYNSPLGIFRSTFDGRFLEVNPALAEMLGYDSPEAVMENIHSIGEQIYIRPADRDAVLCEQRRSEKMGRYVNHYRRRDGSSFIANLYLKTICDAENRPLFFEGIIEDITAQKQMENQLRQLQKSESLGRMAGAIAHHYNNLLSVVMGNLELAMKDLSAPAGAADCLKEASNAAARASQLSGQMLAYMGQAGGERKTLDLCETCRLYLLLLRQDLPEGITLDADLSATAIMVKANPKQVQHMIEALVANAREAIGEQRGEIVIQVKTVYPEEIPEGLRFPVGWQVDESPYACLMVADTGAGIAEPHLEKIFDPFFSTKFTGRGLGLPVVLGNVKTHGGCITMESRPGHGSTCRIFLPLTAAAVERFEDPKNPAINANARNDVVLLVEDHDMVRRMATAMLGQLGFEVVAAENGAEAVRIFREDPRAIDLVISDLTMPDMDGWQTLCALRSIRPEIPFVLASGYDEPRVMTGAGAEQPQAFLHKPFDKKTLKETVERALYAGKA
ncbi:MAG: hybrid sensor histidine kinase/response regulator [Thermodesulfobacteriota bacterium]